MSLDNTQTAAAPLVRADVQRLSRQLQRARSGETKRAKAAYRKGPLVGCRGRRHRVLSGIPNVLGCRPVAFRDLPHEDEVQRNLQRCLLGLDRVAAVGPNRLTILLNAQ